VLFKLSIVNQLILDIFKYTCDFVKWIKKKNLSNEIASYFDLNHESPQLLLIKSNTLIHSASHSGISFSDLDKINC
jgi:bacillithiol system protein YtxJ